MPRSKDFAEGSPPDLAPLGPLGEVPRPEHPRPLLVRPCGCNLNGTWELGFDDADRGLREGWESGWPLPGRVVVPYPIESPLSGVAERAPRRLLWYRRRFEAPAELAAPRVALRVGACDHAARVFLNGREVGAHRGGYAPFACQIGHLLRPGENEVVIRAEDRDTWTQPRGKQEAGALRFPVDYDRVTGIWQTVWLEPLPEVSIEEVWTSFALGAGELAVHVVTSEPWDGEVEVVLTETPEAGSPELCRVAAAGLGRPEARLALRLAAPRLWSPETPWLHGLRVRLRRGERVMDQATSYAGLRELRAQGSRLLLNGEPLALRGILDQGYFPGGWYTAPTDADLRRDVELTRTLGFNLARKHQKAEDPRWLHHADRLGLLVWAEMPSGRDFTTALVADLVPEWMDLVRRDRGHPCVMAWVPFNESWGVWQQARRREERALVEGVAGLTRALDPTRFVVGNDGWEYAAGDLWTLHCYPDEGGSLAERLARLRADPFSPVLPEEHVLGLRSGALPGADPSRLPVVLSECGGIGFMPEDSGRAAGPWGRPDSAQAIPLFAYGDLARSQEDLESRIRAVMGEVRACPDLAGFVWTQLTDVQQEVNGLLRFDRTPKLPLERLRVLFAGEAPATRPGGAEPRS
jgi:hypothetical protein